MGEWGIRAHRSQEPSGRPLRSPDCPGRQGFKLGYASIVTHCYFGKWCGVVRWNVGHTTSADFSVRLAPLRKWRLLRAAPIGFRGNVQSTIWPAQISWLRSKKQNIGHSCENGSENGSIWRTIGTCMMSRMSRQRKHCRCSPRKFGRYFYLLADRRHRRRSTSFPRRAKRPCNGHLAVLIEARSPDRTIGEARTR
jgi:hypothetical protein